MKKITFQGRVLTVPNWSKFVAADCDGKVYAYSHRPSRLDSDNATHYYESEPAEGESPADYLTSHVGRTAPTRELLPVMEIKYEDRRAPLDQKVRLQVGAFRELVMAHQTYQRSLSEFKAAASLGAFNGAQEDVLISACEQDYREITQESLNDLLKQLNDLK